MIKQLSKREVMSLIKNKIRALESEAYLYDQVLDYLKGEE